MWFDKGGRLVRFSESFYVRLFLINYILVVYFKGYVSNVFNE